MALFDAGDNIIIEDGGTDGSGTNAGDNMLYEYYTSFTNSQLLIKDTKVIVLKQFMVLVVMEQYNDSKTSIL